MTDERHPEELLAEYVDGTLPSRARDEVERHLAGCERCREEVDLARHAREALTGLPPLEPPEGIPLAVRREERQRRSTPAVSWLGRVAAVVVLVAGVGAGAAYLLSRDTGTEQESAGQSQAPASEPEAQDGAEEAAPVASDAEAETTEARAAKAPEIPTYRETSRDYRPADLSAFARGLRDEVRRALSAGIPPTARAFLDRFDASAFTPPVRQAIRCVLEEVPPSQFVVPFALEAASFQGEPVYLAAFLQGPTPDQPYDRIVIWVVAREGCALRSLASQQL